MSVQMMYDATRTPTVQRSASTNRWPVPGKAHTRITPRSASALIAHP